MISHINIFIQISEYKLENVTIKSVLGMSGSICNLLSISHT